MNEASFRTNWAQFRLHAKDWWSKLKDRDLDQVDGQLDRFIFLIQEKYLYSRDHAEDDVRDRLESLATPEPLPSEFASFPGVHSDVNVL